MDIRKLDLNLLVMLDVLEARLVARKALASIGLLAPNRVWLAAVNSQGLDRDLARLCAPTESKLHGPDAPGDR